MEKKESFLKRYWLIVLTGLIVGAAAVLLTAYGNPQNMGFCIACFLRDIAGALKLQTAGLTAETGTGIVQYIRPEIIGLVLGAFALSLVRKEFRPVGGSSPMTRFVIAVFVMIGALVFLGCPLRMVIRIGGGDLNAIVGLVGFVIGILIGVLFLRGGFSLGRAYRQGMLEGLMFPALMVALLLLLLFGGNFVASSVSGPGSMRAPILLALLVALVVGALAQQSRLCMVGGIRDAVMFKDFRLISGFIAIIVAVFVGNLLTNKFTGFSFADQPIAHSEWLWNLLGMVLVGWGSLLLGGCPLRQLILAGEGNGDSAVTVFGMIVGAAFAHNFGLAGNADAMNEAKEIVVGGISNNGKAAVCLGILIMLGVSLWNMPKAVSAPVEAAK